MRRKRARLLCQLETLEIRQLLSTIYVDAIAPGTNDGSSWANAYTDLQSALTAATSGTTIEVAQGTYKPTTGTDRTISFQLKDGVAIQGGYAGYGQTNPDARDVNTYPTTLSGDIGTSGDSSDNSYHVVFADQASSTAVLDGFNITGGNANGPMNDQENGGGIRLVGGSPSIIDCTLNGNAASQNGGGISANDSSLNLTDCTFRGNIAGQSGGGMDDDTNSTAILTSCTFAGNSANVAGGISVLFYSAVTLTHCTLSGNTGTRVGGAIYNEGTVTATNCSISDNFSYYGGGISNGGRATITNCTVNGNTAYDGGGIENAGWMALINCSLTGNTANNDGGGMNNGYYVTATDCTISGNTAIEGGGIYNSGSTSTLTNCTVSENSADYGGAIKNIGKATLTNCILWGDNSVKGFLEISGGGSTNVTYSDIQQKGFTSAGNIYANPIFVDASDGNLQIEPDSPAVDAGDNAAVPSGVLTDLAGNNRFQDVPTSAHSGLGTAPIVDMGAYEATAALAASAGGPYVVLPGGSVQLMGLGASDVPGSLRYGWSINHDGNFNDLTDADPKFSAAGYPAGTQVDVTLQVIDSAGNAIEDDAKIMVVAPVLYVDSSATGSGTGNDWANAFTSIATALQSATPGLGQTIDVAQGIYYPTSGPDRTASFQLIDDITLQGGFAPGGSANSDPATHPTILSGDIGARSDNTDNSFHVITANRVYSTAVLDGLTVTAGNTAGDSFPDDNGAGIDAFGSSLSLNACTISGNAAGQGGGIYNGGHSTAILSNCAVTGNTGYNGAGMKNSFSSTALLTNCTINENIGVGLENEFSSMATLNNCTVHANMGSGIVNNGTATLANCTLSGNTAVAGGGMLDYASTAVLTNCTFSGNIASQGGGMEDNFAYSVTLVNCTFSGNIASQSGGAIANQTLFVSTLSNCTFIGNSAGQNGGGIYNDASSPSATTLDNCAFTENSAGNDGGGIYNSQYTSPSLSNCILWGNVATAAGSQIYNSNNQRMVVATYSDIQGGYAGTGNIDADPQFIRNPDPGPDGIWGTADDDYGDLHLQFTSPCIDAGNNAAVPTGVTTDLDGNPRIFDFPGAHDPGAIVDMGAYELGLNLDEVIVPAGQAVALPTGGYDFTANKLTIGAGGTLDVGDDSLGITYTAGNSQAAQIAGWISTGYNAGQWNGTGIISNDTFGQPANLTGVGYFDDGTQVKIRRSWYGDTNLDGVIDADDLSLIVVGQQTHQTNWQSGNFNYDTKVNADDWMTFALVAGFANGQKLIDPSANVPQAMQTNSLIDSPSAIL